MKKKIKAFFLKRLVKKLPIIEICKDFFEYKNFLPQKVEKIVQNLCEEGFFRFSKDIYISYMGEGKFQGVNEEEVFLILTLEDLLDFLRENGRLI